MRSESGIIQRNGTEKQAKQSRIVRHIPGQNIACDVLSQTGHINCDYWWLRGKTCALSKLLQVRFDAKLFSWTLALTCCVMSDHLSMCIHICMCLLWRLQEASQIRPLMLLLLMLMSWWWSLRLMNWTSMNACHLSSLSYVTCSLTTSLPLLNRLWQLQEHIPSLPFLPE